MDRTSHDHALAKVPAVTGGFWVIKILAPRAWLFWAAFILTRPLGATVGDFLDKPVGDGGLDLSRPLATGVLLLAIGVLIAALRAD